MNCPKNHDPSAVCQTCCAAQHEVFTQCPYFGWKREPHQHRYTVVVEWLYTWENPHEQRASVLNRQLRVATKVMCECGEVKSLEAG